MATSTEDYVSFETAKLLKEKGFDEACLTLYREGELVHSAYYLDNKQLDEDNITTPTLQMAMKWLRKVYKLHVNVVPSVEGSYWSEKWHSYVDELNKKYPFGKFIGTFNSHEQACEEAIKYCLNRLI